MALWLFGVAIIVLSVWCIETSIEPPLIVTNFAAVSGRLSSVKSPIQLDDVQMCACFSGPHGQSQRKVKMRISNHDSDLIVPLTGGSNGAIYLFVSYPDTFHPVLNMPDVNENLSATPLTKEDVPSTGTVLLAQKSIHVNPGRVTDAGLRADLGITSGWSAYVLPALPNKVVQDEGSPSPSSSGQIDETYPTFVTKDALRPGESYYSQERGVGDWNFYIPLPPAIRSTASSTFVDVPSQQSESLEKYYRVLGVGVIGSDGQILGFAPTPPPSGFSEGGDL